MNLHGGAGGPGVAAAQSGDDGPVFGKGIGKAPRRAEHAAHAIEARTRDIDGGANTLVAERVEQQIVEAEIERVEAARIPRGHGRLLLGEIAIENRHEVSVGPQGELRRDLRLERPANEHQLAHVVRADPRDPCAALRQHFNQALVGEPAERLGDRKARHVEPRAQRCLVEKRARRQLEVHDRLADGVLHPLHHAAAAQPGEDGKEWIRLFARRFGHSNMLVGRAPLQKVGSRGAGTEARQKAHMPVNKDRDFGRNAMSILSRRFVLGAALAISALGITAPASAQTALKWAHVYEASEPYHKWALWAAEEFKKRTNGKYTIEVFPASSLGKESDINEGLSIGTVDIIYTGQLFAGRNYGPLAIGGAPFMFRDYGHWNAFRKSDLFKELAAGYEKKTGNKVITLTYYGERHVTSNKEINKPEDMKGLKIRVPDAPLYTMFPRAVGANPTPIAFAEVYLALSQGVVDAQENPLPTIQAKKFYEVQKYVVLTGHITDALLSIVSGGTMKRLTPDEQKVLAELLTEAAEKCTNDIVQSEKELVEWFKAQGKTVVQVDKKPFRDMVVKLHSGPDATWDKATYEKLQALQSATN